MDKISSKPKILIVHNYYQVPGGEDIVVANEKKLLENHGHEVVLYSRNNSELKEMNKFQKLFLPFTTVFSIKTYREIKKIIKQQNVDIVHVHNTLSLISPSVYYAAFACNTPVIKTIHNFRLLCPAATFYREDDSGNSHICEMCLSKGLKSAVKYKCYRGSRLQTLASVITLKIHRLLGTYKRLNYICLTDFNKEKLLQINNGKRIVFNPNNVFIKPNFVNSESQCIPYEQRKNQFVFAGRLDRLKGIRLLLEAWKEIKDSDLIICGTGPEENWCKKYIEENGLSNVKVLGFLPNAQVKKIIGESKALILPTQWYEGFPMAIVESLSCGTPVIGSDIGNVGSIIQDGVTGLKFKFDSVESLRDTIKKLTDLVSSSKKQYELNYTAESNYQVLNEIYNEVLNRNKDENIKMRSSTIIDKAIKYKKVNRSKATHFALSYNGKIRYLIALNGGKKRLADNLSSYSKKLEMLMKLLVYLPFSLLKLVRLGYFVSVSIDKEISDYTDKVVEKRFSKYAWNIIVGTYDDKQKLVIQCFDVTKSNFPSIYLKIGDQATAKEMLAEINFLQMGTPYQSFSIPSFVDAQKMEEGYKFNIQISEEFTGEKVAPVLTNEIVKIFKDIAQSRPIEMNNSIPYVFSHGDFAPWNMKRNKDIYIVFDWEHCGYRFYGFDLIHFVFHVENKLYKKPKEEAIKIAIEQAQNFDDILRNIATEKLKQLYLEEYAITYGENGW